MILRFTGDIWQNHPCCVVVMNEQLIKERPIFTQKVMNAIVRAQIWLNDHPEKAASILCKEGGNYLPVSERTLARVFLKYDQATYSHNLPKAIRHPHWPIGRIGFQPYPFPSATRFIIQEMKKAIMEGDQDFLNTISPEVMAQDLVDTTFVKKAINLMGGPGRFREIDLQSPWERQEVISL